MVVIRFADEVVERRAIEALVGEFSFTTWESGECIVPASALAYLAGLGIPYHVEGPATYEQIVPTVRDAAAATVQ